MPLLQIIVARGNAHGDVNVQRTSGVEPWIDGGETHDARFVAELCAAQVGVVVGPGDCADIG
ncbi:hypothetical protein D3C80_1955030 [compost metagenome]